MSIILLFSRLHGLNEVSYTFSDAFSLLCHNRNQSYLKKLRLAIDDYVKKMDYFTFVSNSRQKKYFLDNLVQKGINIDPSNLTTNSGKGVMTSIPQILALLRPDGILCVYIKGPHQNVLSTPIAYIQQNVDQESTLINLGVATEYFFSKLLKLFKINTRSLIDYIVI